MAKRGGKAKAKAQHELEGTLNATKHRGEDLDPGGSIGEPPHYLPGPAKWFWVEAAEWMQKMGTSKACDILHLEAAAMLWFRLQVVNDYIAEHGAEALVDERGKRTGWATESMQLTEKLRMWYNEVGFVPSARASMRSPRKAAGGKDLEARLFNRKRAKGKPDLKVS